MTGPAGLLSVVADSALSVVGWDVAEWLKDRRQVTAVTGDVHAVIAAMGRHNRDEADDRTEPFPVLQRAMEVMDAEFSSGETEDPYRVTVAELVARIAGEGQAVRLAWKDEDERRAADTTCARKPVDFPTAVLPTIREESCDGKEP
jgi:hypothetical protein